MNTLFSLFFQRKKKQKERSVTSALVNDGIVGMIALASPPIQEKRMALKEEKKEKKQNAVKDIIGEKEKVKKEEKKEVVKEEKKKTGKEEKQKTGKEESQRVEKEEKRKPLKEEKQKTVKVEKEKLLDEEKAEKQGEQENPITVRKRNKRRLKVTIAPEVITFESSEKVSLLPLTLMYFN